MCTPELIMDPEQEAQVKIYQHEGKHQANPFTRLTGEQLLVLDGGIWLGGGCCYLSTQLTQDTYLLIHDNYAFLLQVLPGGKVLLMDRFTQRRQDTLTELLITEAQLREYLSTYVEVHQAEQCRFSGEPTDNVLYDVVQAHVRQHYPKVQR